MNYSRYQKVCFIVIAVWCSVSYSMNLITKKGMTPQRAVEKCIKDCNYRGLRELIYESFYTGEITSKSLCNDIDRIIKQGKSDCRTGLAIGYIGISLGLPLVVAESCGIFKLGKITGYILGSDSLIAGYYAYKAFNSFQSNKLLIKVHKNILKIKEKEDLT